VLGIEIERWAIFVNCPLVPVKAIVFIFDKWADSIAFIIFLE
jgi:hypothetical protein